MVQHKAGVLHTFLSSPTSPPIMKRGPLADKTRVLSWHCRLPLLSNDTAFRGLVTGSVLWRLPWLRWSCPSCLFVERQLMPGKTMSPIQGLYGAVLSLCRVQTTTAHLSKLLAITRWRNKKYFFLSRFTFLQCVLTETTSFLLSHVA